MCGDVHNSWKVLQQTCNEVWTRRGFHRWGRNRDRHGSKIGSMAIIYTLVVAEGQLSYSQIDLVDSGTCQARIGGLHAASRSQDTVWRPLSEYLYTLGQPEQ